MANVVLGVCGSVAAYRACDLARDLELAGHQVRVCLSDSAQKFVTPALFEALTGHPCLASTFDQPVAGEMAHIEWARWADLVLVAPATANTLARLAGGTSEDMLTSLVLATDAPLVVAPAMNPTMFAQPANQSALAALESRGAIVVRPMAGEVACGESGTGKLAENSTILAAALSVIAFRRSWRGHVVALTSGPTREAIDDVRFVSNRSSGKMGQAIAQAAVMAGATVRVVSGPVSVVYPAAAQVRRVESAQEMLAAALEVAEGASLFLGVAAVADYRPVSRAPGKLRRTDSRVTLELTPNPDVIASVAASGKARRVVAFAAEPDDRLDEARAKAARKGVWGIVANQVGAEGTGFEADSNRLVLLTHETTHDSGVRSKFACATWLLDLLAER